MKYDKPVWKIMHLCADAMPSTFRYEHVRGWFSTYYPEVNDATIRAHLIGLTDGGSAKHIQFAARSPLFRRVARGEYEPIPAAQRGEHPNGSPPRVPEAPGAATRTVTTRSEPVRARGPVPDIVLLGSLGARVGVPAPAKEIFREPAFQLSRLDAEASGSRWFVLSAAHGLVAPHEWMSPDTGTLADLDPDYRVIWAGWVVARLRSLVGPLGGQRVRVHAPDAFLGPLFAVLQEVGAVVTSGTFVAPQPPVVEQIAEPEPEEPPAPPAPEVVPVSRSSVAAAHLLDVGNVRPAGDTDALPEAPGLYAWFVDPDGARVLNRCLMLPVRSGLLFVGQVGGSTWQTLADPVRTLRDHIEHVQLRGQARGSTFRTVLSTVLREHLGMTSADDRRLTEWMLQHLSVSTWVSENVGRLHALEQLVAGELNPPLNVDHLSGTQYRIRINQMRSSLAPERA